MSKITFSLLHFGYWDSLKLPPRDFRPPSVTAPPASIDSILVLKDSTLCSPLYMVEGDAKIWASSLISVEVENSLSSRGISTGRPNPLLSEIHSDIKNLITDLPVTDWDEKWMDVYMNISVKLLDISNSFTSEFTRLNQGHLILQYVLYKLESDSPEQFTRASSSLNNWKEHISSKNLIIETCRPILDNLVESLNLPKVKNSSKGNVLMRAMYGAKVATTYICSVFVAAFSCSSKHLMSDRESPHSERKSNRPEGSSNSPALARHGEERTPPVVPVRDQGLFFKTLNVVLSRFQPFASSTPQINIANELKGLRAPEFKGEVEEDPIVADLWLNDVKIMLNRLHCSDVEKLDRIVSLLRGQARIWIDEDVEDPEILAGKSQYYGKVVDFNRVENQYSIWEITCGREKKAPEAYLLSCFFFFSWLQLPKESLYKFKTPRRENWKAPEAYLLSFFLFFSWLQLSKMFDRESPRSERRSNRPDGSSNSPALARDDEERIPPVVPVRYQGLFFGTLNVVLSRFQLFAPSAPQMNIAKELKGLGAHDFKGEVEEDPVTTDL
ncbi:UPF0496 protein 4 [Hibiscus syriacus]|uniref:UPF0496 protein 4 n=1 Tax=Hibiscus syriacus TaxID=106335 RepID=A0A6A3BMW9_HIBSY|nr:UPF0496 protein 4 [Hibiscus syriacus]